MSACASEQIHFNDPILEIIPETEPIPDFDPRFDWLAKQVVMPVFEGMDAVKELAENAVRPIKLDLSEKAPRDRILTLACVLGGTAMLGLDHLRGAVMTPATIQAAHDTNPVGGALVGAGIHLAWFMLYANSIRLIVKQLPNTLAAITKKLPIKHVERMPGLAPHSTEPSEELSKRDRIKKRIELRSKRLAAMKATGGILSYILLAAHQKQEDRDQRKLCNDMVLDGTFGSFTRALTITSAIALTGIFDSGLSNEINDASQSLEGIAAFTFGPAAVMLGIYGAKRLWRKHKANSSTDEAPNNAAVLS